MNLVGEEVVVALYDYQAKDAEELTIRKNEQLTLLDGSGPWYKVQNKLMLVGLVPSNYVKCKQGSFVNRIANKFPGAKKSKGGASASRGNHRLDAGSAVNVLGFHSSNNLDGDGSIRRLKDNKTMGEIYIAKYDYDSNRSDELGLSKGMVITVMTKDNDGWWQGSSPDGQVGWFPSNYVEESTDEWSSPSLNMAVSAAKPALEVAQALYSFNSGNPEELPIEAGDMLDIISKPEADPEWYEARNAEGKTGLVPRNYIETVPGASSVFLQEPSSYDDVSQEMAGNNNSVSSHQSYGNGDGPNSMSNKPWYFGAIKRAEAESMLRTRARNSEYMVRDSESMKGDLSVSMKAPDRIKHFKVSLRDGKYCIGQRKFDSVEALIEHYKKSPIYTAPDVGKICLSQPMPR